MPTKEELTTELAKLREKLSLQENELAATRTKIAEAEKKLATLPPSTPVKTDRSKLKVDLDFSRGEADVKKRVWTMQQTKDYSFQIIGDTYKGQKMGRFEMRKNDGSVRSELAFRVIETPIQRLGFAVRFPKEVFSIPEDEFLIFLQYHASDEHDAGEKSLPPPIALFVQQGRIKAAFHQDSNRVTTTDKDKDYSYDIGPVPLDEKPVEFILYNFISHKPGEGVTRVAMNGKEVVEHREGNSYNDKNWGYWKIGGYKRNWKKWSKWYLDFSHVRIAAGPDSSWEHVAPGN